MLDLKPGKTRENHLTPTLLVFSILNNSRVGRTPDHCDC